MGKPARLAQAIPACALLLCLILSGCSSDDSSPVPTATGQPDAPTPTVRTSLSPVPTAALAPTPPAEPFPEPVGLAIGMAADDTGVDRDRVRLVSYEEREWPSTALGCPQPGFSYHQVVTPGYFVRLEIEGETFIYHTNRASTVVNCTPAG